jgi:hypothetical protein
VRRARKSVQHKMQSTAPWVLRAPTVWGKF